MHSAPATFPIETGCQKPARNHQICPRDASQNQRRTAATQIQCTQNRQSLYLIFEWLFEPLFGIQRRVLEENPNG
ncbi:hypothetical protein QMZ25_04695 [Stenotrophomonas sp. RS-48]|jgi:hypothetical protein|nr:hypothetical protein [Stenotrophomonas sp. RS-48]